MRMRRCGGTGTRSRGRAGWSAPKSRKRAISRSRRSCCATQRRSPESGFSMSAAGPARRPWRPPPAPVPMALRGPDYLRGVLSGAGFAEIAIEPTPFHVIGKSAASEAEHAGALGPSGRLLDEKEADPATRRAVVQETEAGFAAQFGREGQIRLPGMFFLLRARRPG